MISKNALCVHDTTHFCVYSRVRSIVDGVKTFHIAGVFEFIENGATDKMTTYYDGNAMRRSGYGIDDGVFYLLQDHLKSSSSFVNQSGATWANNYYYPYGGNRGGAFSNLTTKRFTGQYHEKDLPGGEGLSYYNARWYDAKLGRFLSADTIVPGPANPQAFNRYSYVFNNPMRFTDPSGHYGKDVHQGTTHIVGTIVIEQVNQFYGLAVDSSKLAETIAGYNQGTDDNPSTWPYNGQVQSFSEYGETQPVEMETVKYYHFVGKGEAERRLLYSAAQGDVKGFGQALHLYQDTFSHIESGYTLPYGQAGIDDLRAMCRSCYGADPVRNLYMDSLAANFFGHALPASKAAAASSIWGAALSTDTFTGGARDMRMVNGTSFWITMYALLNAQKSQSEIDEYFQATYQMTSQEYYSQKVLENN